jgi:hypothetical protein
MWIFRNVLLRRLFLHSSHLLVPIVTNRFLLLSGRSGCESSGRYCCVDSSRTLHTWKPGSFYASAPVRNRYELRYLADNFKLSRIDKVSVADPHHFNVDLDPAFHFNAGPDLDPASPLQKDMYLRLLSIDPPGLHFEPTKLFYFDFNADPDLDSAFYSNADPDPASTNKGDPCRSGSTTLDKILLLLLLNSIHSLQGSRISRIRILSPNKSSTTGQDQPLFQTNVSISTNDLIRPEYLVLFCWHKFFMKKYWYLKFSFVVFSLNQDMPSY